MHPARISRFPLLVALLLGFLAHVSAQQSFPAKNVTLLSWLPLTEFGTNIKGRDCWGYVSPSGREYGIFAHTAGTAFVEITDPENPQLIAQVGGCTDVKVYEQYAYVVGDGIQVIDLSRIDSGLVSLVGNVGAGDTHNIAIDEVSGFLYRCGSRERGLLIYDLAIPADPVFVFAGSWQDRDVHDAQVVTYNSGPYRGRQIAFCCTSGDGTLDIVDVTDKQNPFLVSSTPYSNNEFSHQGWLSEDRQYFYLNDECAGAEPTTTIVFDVSDINNAFQAGTFTNGNPSRNHNLYVRGDLIFEANYTSGLRVFDATDPLNPVEAAFFDTYPENDAAFDNGHAQIGLWSVFPFFPSGTVIGSDVARGLFVWSLTRPLPPPCLITEPVAVSCVENAADVDLTWDEGKNDYTGGVEIIRDCTLVGMVSAGVEAFTDVGVPPGLHHYVVRGIDSDGGCSRDSSACSVELGTPILRGDCNDDGEVNLSDASCALNWMFAEAGKPGCIAALNTNGDDKVDIADPVSLLNFLFAAGPAPATPFPDCGPGTLEVDEELGCANPPNCQ